MNKKVGVNKTKLSCYSTSVDGAENFQNKAENVPYIFRHFHHPWRLAEPSQNKEYTYLARQALDGNEGTTLYTLPNTQSARS
ncbi:hypothetical protein SHVI106290_14570 [Shewanella violacea]|uniref:Uncharacterized protein n=1 Tax=Shewanella violacea (strain JCM 10179 / CIP 106290 / LMG 19151 / DSS12) TaxID=637905 RepID=D4ZBM4_SHEVD|nr:hypothetical protein SVI_3448 [Shewanella violacea DSS12]